MRITLDLWVSAISELAWRRVESDMMITITLTQPTVPLHLYRAMCEGVPECEAK